MYLKVTVAIVWQLDWIRTTVKAGDQSRLSKCTMMAQTREKAWRTGGQMWKCVDIRSTVYED